LQLCNRCHIGLCITTDLEASRTVTALDIRRRGLIFQGNGGDLMSDVVALVTAFLVGGAFAGLALWKLRKYCVP
jgi:hypothetical protein